MAVREEQLRCGHRLVHLSEVDSTNSEAMRRGLAGLVAPLWVMTDQQTEGRGRAGRQWLDARGNLFASCALRLKKPVHKAYQLSLVAGVAVADAITRQFGEGVQLPLRLKWPNDILIDRKKAGGILIESTELGGDLLAIIGVGLNIASHPSALAIPATHLRTYGDFPEPRSFLEDLAASVDAWLRVWRDGDGFDAIRLRWLSLAGSPGETCTVNSSEGICSGRFVGLDEDGALLLRDEMGALRRFTFGDVDLSP